METVPPFFTLNNKYSAAGKRQQTLAKRPARTRSQPKPSISPPEKCFHFSSRQAISQGVGLALSNLQTLITSNPSGAKKSLAIKYPYRLGKSNQNRFSLGDGAIHLHETKKMAEQEAQTNQGKAKIDCMTDFVSFRDSKTMILLC